MKTLLIALVCLFSVASFAEGKFDSGKWNSFADKAKEQVAKELSNEFIFNNLGWEKGKGADFFVKVDFLGVMKFDSEGRLVKVASEDDFPELVKFDSRRMELLKQFREEYAKSIGMTVEECEKKSRRLPASRLLGGRDLSASRLNKQTEEEKQQERAELLPKIEQFVGYKFGQPPIEGVAVETNTHYRGFNSQKTTEIEQKVHLQKPYRYMRDASLTFRNNKLCKVSLYVDFGDEYSDESIGQEHKVVEKDLLEKLGLKEKDPRFVVYYGGFSISIRQWRKRLSVAFTDEQTIDAFDEAEQEAMHKQGRALPSVEDWQKEEEVH